MGKIIEGDSRHWLIVNTAEYNDDGRWAVQAAAYGELYDLGFDTLDLARIAQMKVGQVLSDWDEAGVLVIRLS